MRISIITVVYNNKAFIESAMRSVINQQYPDLQYIVVDGGSNDGTLPIIKQLLAHSAIDYKLVSEPDKGIYDAMNKGLKMADGEILAFLNADDIYFDDAVLQRVAHKFNQTGADSLYGDLVYVDRLNTRQIIRYWKSGHYNLSRFSYGWMPPHPTFFVKKQVFDKYGCFDTRLKSAADYELMVRFLYKHKISTAYLPRILVKMRAGGVSNKGVVNRIKANIEDRKAWAFNGYHYKTITTLIKPARKIPQFLARKTSRRGF